MADNLTSTLHLYSLTSPIALSVAQRGLECLRSHLPTSLPLYRRLQFGRFLDASCVITNIPCHDTEHHRWGRSNSEDDGNEHEEPPWLMAFVDRSCRPETEVYFFGSWESSPAPPAAKEIWEPIDALVLELVKKVKTLPLPRSIHQDALDAEANKAASLPLPPLPPSNLTPGTTDTSFDKDTQGYDRHDYSAHMANPDIMLWGAIHASSAAVLTRLGLIPPIYSTSLGANHTFVFDVAKLPPPKPLPEGLTWGVVRPEFFALVRSRTQIPRQERTMATLPSLAIYPGKSDGSVLPIAWAFVGLDSSLTTLHVEPAWRGQGLAKILTAKLFREKMEAFFAGDEEAEGWGGAAGEVGRQNGRVANGVNGKKGKAGSGKRLAHGYVMVGNKASESMCKSIGGVSEWQCYWLRVDLGNV